MIKYNEINLK